jgi:hypothetical protein
VERQAGRARGRVWDRRRIQAAHGKRLLAQRGEKVERNFAHQFHSGRLDRLLPLPAAPYEACHRQHHARQFAASGARFQTNDYSVPVEYGHRQVPVKAFVWEVVIACSSEAIARRARNYGREEMLEHKTNALDPAAPLQGWQLPKS